MTGVPESVGFSVAFSFNAYTVHVTEGYRNS